MPRKLFTGRRKLFPELKSLGVADSVEIWKFLETWISPLLNSFTSYPRVTVPQSFYQQHYHNIEVVETEADVAPRLKFTLLTAKLKVRELICRKRTWEKSNMLNATCKHTKADKHYAETRQSALQSWNCWGKDGKNQSNFSCHLECRCVITGRRLRSHQTDILVDTTTCRAWIWMDTWFCWPRPKKVCLNCSVSQPLALLISKCVFFKVVTPLFCLVCNKFKEYV